MLQHIIDRFIKYVSIDTQSDPNNPAFPSTEKQWTLAKLLEKELKFIGLTDVNLDENCYLTATLPSNISYKVPTIGFVAHIDTSPDFSAAHVNPQVHKNYDGKAIVLNADDPIILDPKEFKELINYKGQTLITTDGNSLLGADDKAGITEIVTAMEFLLTHPEIKHGILKICFTPDEEVGKGAHKFDVKSFNADWAYTMDGSELGELEFENFNAAIGLVEIKGKIVHPGYAKGIMINAMTIATQFITALPANEVPEQTDDYQGFYHLYGMKGSVEKASLQYIIRDHDRQKFEARKLHFSATADALNKKLGNNLIATTIKDQYFNMREKVEPVMHIVDIAKEAMIQAGIKPNIKAIRGGTDGAQLSYMGLPCPNIFAGGHNFHGRYEYVPAESIQKATEVIINIAQITAKKFEH
ncbi:MAG: peptidase T [Flavobacteriales bacterium CG_4_8_14_3_um_filter_35_10]|nr:peptidase T [Zetaproteobacteria bacterium]PIX07837.1 MAG: peptidase T [Flavobacteriales bacterium CG_4_8_14_3_um_filter_35_10]